MDEEIDELEALDREIARLQTKTPEEVQAERDAKIALRKALVDLIPKYGRVGEGLAVIECPYTTIVVRKPTKAEYSKLANQDTASLDLESLTAYVGRHTVFPERPLDLLDKYQGLVGQAVIELHKLMGGAPKKS